MLSTTSQAPTAGVRCSSENPTQTPVFLYPPVPNQVQLTPRSHTVTSNAGRTNAYTPADRNLQALGAKYTEPKTYLTLKTETHHQSQNTSIAVVLRCALKSLSCRLTLPRHISARIGELLISDLDSEKQRLYRDRSALYRWTTIAHSTLL